MSSIVGTVPDVGAVLPVERYTSVGTLPLQAATGVQSKIALLNVTLPARMPGLPGAAQGVTLRATGVLGVSAPTVKRDWALARAWLHRELGGGV